MATELDDADRGGEVAVTQTSINSTEYNKEITERVAEDQRLIDQVNVNNEDIENAQSDIVTNATAAALNTAHRGLTNDPHGSVDDTAYDATSWNSVTNVAPSKNTVRDKFAYIDDVVAALGGDISTNSTHVAGDGSDHADVATNSAHGADTNDPHGSVDDTAYNIDSWNAVTNVAPSKNVVRDKFASIDDVALAIAGEIATRRLHGAAVIAGATHTMSADGNDILIFTGACTITWIAPTGYPEGYVQRMINRGGASNIQWATTDGAIFYQDYGSGYQVMAQGDSCEFVVIDMGSGNVWVYMDQSTQVT